MARRDEWLESGALLLVARAERWLEKRDAGRAERAGERLGLLFGRLSRKHRDRALANLELAFPDMLSVEREALVRAVFAHFGRSAADFLQGRRRTREELEATTEVVGVHHLVEARDLGQGTILITGHFGNWERISAWMSWNGYPVTVIARDADQRGVNHLVNEIRQVPGTQVVARGNSTRAILSLLRSNGMVGILPDQNSEEHFIRFFGKPCGVALGPGVLKERTGASLLPCNCRWISPGRYRIEFSPLIEVPPNQEVKGAVAMQKIHDYLEEVIRAHPEQWLWFHDRWRSARKRGML